MKDEGIIIMNIKRKHLTFEELYGAEILEVLEVTRISVNDITLLPELLK